jgi:hypothetical protein
MCSQLEIMDYFSVMKPGKYPAYGKSEMYR